MHANQASSRRPHEVCLQERRVERESESRRLFKLKEQLRIVARQTRLARAS